MKSDTNGAVRYVQAGRVSAGYFDVLGIPLLRGRSFDANEDRPNGPPVAVLSNALWRSTFRSDDQIIGKAIHLKGEPYTVVGVLPPNAVTPMKADLFTALKPATTGECGGKNCGIFVRLEPGANWPQVNAELNHVQLPWFRYFDLKPHSRVWVYARPLQMELASAVKNRISLLMLTVVFILLIACANLAGLTLVRVSRREPEIATRLALGASRWQVIRQLWTENLVLAIVGGACGVGCAALIVAVSTRTLPEAMIPLGGLSLDPHVLAFAFGAAMLTSLLFGALPALQIRSVDLRSSIAGGSRTLAKGSSRPRKVMIAGEVALTVVLLAVAGLMARTLVYLQTRPLGFDPHQVITAKASLDDARYRDADAFHALLARSVTAMREIPGVQDAAVGLSVPYERGLNDGLKILDGKRAGVEDGSSLSYVTPGYFSTLRIPLLGGRSFTDRDTPGSEFVAIANQAFCRQFFQIPNALGHHFQSGKNTYTIVGIASDVAKSLGMKSGDPIATEPVFYLPATQADQHQVNGAHIWFEPSWIVRSETADRSILTHQMQQALASVDPSLPFSGFYSMDQILAQQLQQQRIEVFLLTTLSGLALLLSAIGIYALVSNLVVQRTREIGIRIALGSTIRRAMFDIGSSGIAAAFAGVICGIALSFLAVRVLASEIYGITVYDPITMISAPLLLASIAILASLLPTVRITRMQPSDTLRAE